MGAPGAVEGEWLIGPSSIMGENERPRPGFGTGSVGTGGEPAGQLLKEAFEVSTIAANAAGSRMAMSARIFRSTSTPAALSPAMKRPYGTPCWREAALMRSIQRRRMSRLRLRRSRYA